eukprot:17007-Heterococcus_DN1.PRE.1
MVCISWALVTAIITLDVCSLAAESQAHSATPQQHHGTFTAAMLLDAHAPFIACTAYDSSASNAQIACYMNTLSKILNILLDACTALQCCEPAAGEVWITAHAYSHYKSCTTAGLLSAALKLRRSTELDAER